MQIAICDDDKDFRSELRDMILDFRIEKRFAADIFEYDKAEDLLDSGVVFDLIFLDQQLPGVSGMEAARSLRRINCMCGIIFVTGYPQFVFDSFEVQPFRFFVKPVGKEKVAAAIDSYIQQNKLQSPIIIVQDNRRFSVDSRDIIYLEGQGKYCLVRTKDETFRSSRTISGVQQLLPVHCFYRIHKSYVVNMYYVSSIQGSEVVLLNGERASISRSHLKDFRKSYAEFVKNYYVRL